MISKDRTFATGTYPNQFWQILTAGLVNLNWDEIQSLCKKFNISENDFWDMAKELKDNFLQKESNLHPVFEGVFDVFNTIATITKPVQEDLQCADCHHNWNFVNMQKKTGHCYMFEDFVPHCKKKLKVNDYRNGKSVAEDWHKNFDVE